MQDALDAWAELQADFHQLQTSCCFDWCDGQGSSETELILQINNQIRDRQNVFFDMEAYLPKRNRFAYKDEYEKFKLYLTIILLLGAVACRFVLHYRIKGWWVSHHYISTFLSGVMLTWPEGLMYQMFRNQFLSFSIFQSKGVSVLDVARSDVSPPFFVLWAVLATLQCNHPFRTVQAQEVQRMASFSSGSDISDSLPRKLPHHVESGPYKIPEKQNQEVVKEED
ncbi:hypothetical protein Chor_012938 [Crotalus horridus]